MTVTESLKTTDMESFYRDITPAMADGWHEYIMPEVPYNFAIGFNTLVDRVYDRLLAAQHQGIHPVLEPKGNITNAVLAMGCQNELIVDDANVRRGCVR